MYVICVKCECKGIAKSPNWVKHTYKAVYIRVGMSTGGYR